LTPGSAAFATDGPVAAHATSDKAQRILTPIVRNIGRCREALDQVTASLDDNSRAHAWTLAPGSPRTELAAWSRPPKFGGGCCSRGEPSWTRLATALSSRLAAGGARGQRMLGARKCEEPSRTPVCAGGALEPLTSTCRIPAGSSGMAGPDQARWGSMSRSCAYRLMRSRSQGARSFPERSTSHRTHGSGRGQSYFM
jgi:hypothetical protein